MAKKLSSGDDLAFTPAAELRQMVAAKKVSPVELANLYLRRIESLDGRLHSFLTVDHDGAMRSAKAAEQAVMRGDPLGPLHGVPISVKDLDMTSGLRTTNGSLAFKDWVPDEDSVHVEWVRRAGAVILGKTNTPEFGMFGLTENRLGPPCGNPWDLSRTAGGSSGGAASSVGAGLAPIATGGDGGGSIRIPAAFCGLYGIKPTLGRVPLYLGKGAIPVANLTGQIGPITRTVRDAAMLLQVMAGHDPRDSESATVTPPDFAAAVDRDVKGLHIAWTPDYGYAPVDPEVAKTAATAAKSFEGLGCRVEEANLGFGTPFDAWWTVFCVNVYVNLKPVLEKQREDLTWYVRECLEYGAGVSGAQYAAALGQIAVLKARLADVFAKYDLILSPTLAVPAFPHSQPPKEIGGHHIAKPFWSFFPFTYPINISGHPAASVPCGFSSGGLPIGLHIIGRHWDEETVLSASAAYERAKPWVHRRPPIAA
ncbi:MAG: amidase [SAR202 cluster bacterium]|nr:amidase [SAR202 cluster bacterium]